jgi:hypothetical protein
MSLIEPIRQTPTAEPTEARPQMTMLERAVENGASIEILTKLMDLQERHERNQARRAFDTAVANAKAEMPVVVKNREGHNGKRYADFAAIAKAVDPVITAHGLSYRFRITQTDKITVTCVLSHEAGHAEETTLSGPADASGSKNAIQAIGSTLSYLQRYSLVAALGLAVAEDDDGHGAGDGVVISEKQEAALREALDNSGAPVPAFCRAFKIDSLGDLPAARFDEAMRRIAQRGANAQ